MAYSDDLPVGIKCPDCSHEFAEFIGKLKADPSLACPKCGVQIEVPKVASGTARIDED